MTFEEYWRDVGSRIQVESHEERARLAWEFIEAQTPPRRPLTKEEAEAGLVFSDDY